jgi:hypothetical protein
MKALTAGEATVVRSLLASERISERERIRNSGVPPRTFEGIRQRAYTEGWVFERYVPDPSLVRKLSVTFAIVQPFMEHREEVKDAWKNDERCVLLWRWPETLFGVFISEKPLSEFTSRDISQVTFSQSFELHTDTREPQVPVYFDFEGSWSRLANLPGALAYPHPLPLMLTDAQSLVSYPVSESDRRGLADLVRRPILREGSAGPLRVSPFFLPRYLQRLLGSGAIERRVFLDLKKIPPCRETSIEAVAFVRAELLPDASPSSLFRRLASIRVLPFLFATDGLKILLGALSPAPPAQLGERLRPAVLTNLQRFLRSIEITRERVGSLEVVVSHRYDRLFATA